MLSLKNFQKILGKLKDVEQELEAIGDNMKQLESSAEKAQASELALDEIILNPRTLLFHLLPRHAI